MSGYSLLSFEGIGPRAAGPGRWSLNSPKAYWEAGRQERAGTSRSPHPWVPAPLSRWAYSSVGLEHTPDKREVGSSNLPRPTTYR